MLHAPTMPMMGGVGGVARGCVMQDDGQLNSLKEGVSAVQVDRVIVLWTANTERYSEVAEGLNDTTEAFLSSIDNDESEVAPSSIYAAASILEGAPFINGSPQNTFVPGLIDMAIEKGGHIDYLHCWLLKQARRRASQRSKQRGPALEHATAKQH